MGVRVIAVWIGLWASLALGAPEMIPEQAPALLGRTAPSFELSTLSGETFRIQEQTGRPVVLAFWASWCGPCRLELPALSDLALKRTGVDFYAVNVDRQQGPARAFTKKVRVEVPILWDNQAKVMGLFQVMSMPTLFVIDAKGTVKYQKVGYSREKKLVELEAALDELQ